MPLEKLQLLYYDTAFDTRKICDEVSGQTGADVVQVIGNKFILYRESKENPSIRLP